MTEKLELMATAKAGVVEFNFEHLKKELTEKVQHYKALVVTEETTGIAKKERAKLNTLKKDINSKRLEIVREYSKPADEFANRTKELIEIIDDAASSIDTQVKAFEQAQIIKKTETIKSFFVEQAAGVDFINFEQTGIKIGLSNSIKSLKDEVTTFVERIKSDLELIDTQKHKERILVRFKNNLNVSDAITSVNREIEQEEALKATQADQAKKKEEATYENIVAENIEVLQAPKEILSITFTVTDTKENIIKVREFMKAEGIKYE